MRDGITRRIVSLWMPRLASDRVLRAWPDEGPFALTLNQKNTNRIFCLNAPAERQGLYRGMPLSDARAFCPELNSRPGDPAADWRFLMGLRRWLTRYCPWIGVEGRDGLVLDVTGSTHLWGGEAAMLADLRQRFAGAGLSVQIGLGDTRGAAWALAHHGEGVARPQQPLATLSPLPVAALRLEEEVVTALQRLGLRTIGDLAAAARAPLARRFGPGLLMRLDQALGAQPEEIAPLQEPPHYGVRLSLPEPIGLLDDLMAGIERLLVRLCQKLDRQEAGARMLCLTLRRVDQSDRWIELRLARPLRDAARILPLFARAMGDVDAGFGIDQLRLEARQVEPLRVEQVNHVASDRQDRLDDLISRIGTGIGLENIQRILPADSHIPERSFIIAPAAYSRAEDGWSHSPPRPLMLFPPEFISAKGARPPRKFRWRRVQFTTLRVTGPERIAPEWWLDDENWRSGLRDYWRVETRQGRRLWLFHTPQDPGWYVQGEFA